MLFNSIEFVLFFPVVTLVYFLLPGAVRYLWLLGASYYFYMCWNAQYALLMLFSTAATYLSGMLMERVDCGDKPQDQKQARKKWIVAGCFAVNLAILFFYKYFNFTADLVTKVLYTAGIAYTVPAIDVLLPVGISFYTFQALSYTMDVYRGDIEPEHNFFRYALFVSFFPQLVAGPIERSGNLLHQLKEVRRFSYERAREGFLIMLWGFFLKIVLADRVAIFVDTVYNDVASFGGWYLIVATVLFAVQIYCDFLGYSTIALGAARVLGINLMENFDAPYLSCSVSGFWRRWHISLTSWFKDYLYIPLGGSRKGQTRKYANKLIVFLVSGLWHGAQITFVVWGGLNGLYQILEEALAPARESLVRKLGMNRESLAHKLLQGLVTFVLVDFAWIFFRAEGMSHAMTVIRSIFTADNLWILFDGSLYGCGLDEKNFLLMLAGIGLLLFADVCRRRGIVIRHVILAQDGWFRGLFFAVSISLILLFGLWGPAFDQANFIYFQF